MAWDWFKGLEFIFYNTKHDLKKSKFFKVLSKFGDLQGVRRINYD